MTRLPPSPPEDWSSPRDFGGNQRDRRMPTLWQIAHHWHVDGPFEMHIRQPSCFACRNVGSEQVARKMTTLFPKDRWALGSCFLERAHLVNHAWGGLDAVQNIVPLCLRCHRKMPSFRCGTGRWAVAWVQGGGRWDRLPETMQKLTAEWAAGACGWRDYVAGCYALTGGVDWEKAEACALAIDFTGRGLGGIYAEAHGHLQ